MTGPETLLRQMFDAAIAAAQPDVCVPPFLPAAPATGRLVVIGAGKASAAMARAAEAHYGRPLEGIVVTRYGHAVTCDGVEIVEAGHPVPDEAGRHAARRILNLAEGLFRPLVSDMTLFLLLLMPAVTMRLFAPEYRSGIYDMTASWPVADHVWVLGKWLSALGTAAILIIAAAAYFLVVWFLGDPEPGPVLVAHRSRHGHPGSHRIGAMVPAGAGHYRDTGSALPERSMERARKADAVLLSAIGLPAVRYEDGTEIRPQVDLRMALDLYAGVRPVRFFPGGGCPLSDPRAAQIDFVLVRESTEGLFAHMHEGQVIGDEARRQHTSQCGRPNADARYTTGVTRRGCRDRGEVRRHGARLVHRKCQRVVVRTGARHVTGPVREDIPAIRRRGDVRYRHAVGVPPVHRPAVDRTTGSRRSKGFA